MSSFEKTFEEKYNPIRPTSFIVRLKKNVNGELDELKEMTSFLDEHYTNPAITQRLFHYVKQDFFIYECPVCSSPLMYREKTNADYLKTCGKDECRKKQNHISTQKGIKEKYGVDNISQTSFWKEKVRSTNIERRGVEWNTQSKEFIKARDAAWESNKSSRLKKKVETNMQRYGVEHPLMNKEIANKSKETMKNSYDFKFTRLERAKQTNREKYGFDWYTETEIFKNKSKETLLEKYDVSHNSYNAKTLDKRWASSRKHEYVFPSGKVVIVQGYEPRCIDELLQNGHSEEDIIVGNVEIQKYVGKINYVGFDDKVHRYYPDVYVPSLNKVIEVKSGYTLTKDINIAKKKTATEKLGFNYELRVY
jgi:hypothetical protein